MANKARMFVTDPTTGKKVEALTLRELIDELSEFSEEVQDLPVRIEDEYGADAYIIQVDVGEPTLIINLSLEEEP